MDDSSCLTFLCDEVTLDGQRLLPLDPAVNFVFLRINIGTEEMLFVYKDSIDPLAEECEVVFRWEHIIDTTTIKEPTNSVFEFEFDSNLCGYSKCRLIVSNLVFERLATVVELMFFSIMHSRYGYNEEQARAFIHDHYVMEDYDFGPEHLYAAGPGAPLIPEEEPDNNSLASISSWSTDEENESEYVSEVVFDHEMNVLESVSEGEAIAQLTNDEKPEQVVTVNENETVVQQAIEEKTEEIEPVEETATIVQAAVEENAEKESPLTCDENDAEEK